MKHHPRTRKAEGRNALVHLLRQVHRTETRKVTKMYYRQPYPNFRKSICQYWKFKCLLACSRMFKTQSASWMQIRRQMYLQTHSKSAADEKNNEASIAFHIPSNENDRSNYREINRMTRPTSETSPSREQIRSENTIRPTKVLDQAPHEHGVTTLAIGKRNATLGKACTEMEV